MVDVNGNGSCRNGYVYQFKDAAGRVIYVGKTGDIDKRMQEHFGSSGHLPQEVYDAVTSVEYMALPTYADAGIAERYLIGKLMPEANTQYVDEGFVTLHVDLYPHCWEVYGGQTVADVDGRVRGDAAAAGTGVRAAKKLSGPLVGYRSWLEGEMAGFAAGDQNRVREVYREAVMTGFPMVFWLYKDYEAFCKENRIGKRFANLKRFEKQFLSDVGWLAELIDRYGDRIAPSVEDFAIDVFPRLQLPVLPVELAYALYQRWMDAAGTRFATYDVDRFMDEAARVVGRFGGSLGFECEEVGDRKCIPEYVFDVHEPLLAEYRLSDWVDVVHDDGGEQYGSCLREDLKDGYSHYPEFFVRIGNTFEGDGVSADDRDRQVEGDVSGETETVCRD